MKCKKYNSENIDIKYRNLNGIVPNAFGINGEFLHCTCNICGYIWSSKTKDMEKANES